MKRFVGQFGGAVEQLKPASVEEKLIEQNPSLKMLGDADAYLKEGDWLAVLWGDLRWAGSTNPPLHECLKRFRQEQSSCLKNAYGHFRLAVINVAQDEMWLAIDRTGVRRLFYSVEQGALYFSSHLKPVVAQRKAGAQLNAQALYNYVYFHMIPSPDTVYQHCHKLEPGHVLHFAQGKLVKRNYFPPQFVAKGEVSVDSAQQCLLPSLEASVKRARSNGLNGAFLSGGLDSSTVAGVLAKVSDAAPPTFNIAFDQEQYDESPWARLTAQHFHTVHHEYRLQPDEALASLTRIAQAFEEPFGNSSALPTFFCARVAKEQGVQRLLAGDGGDELFAGNTRYAKQKWFEVYGKTPALLRRGLESALNIESGKRWPGPLGKMQSYIRQARVPAAERLQAYNFLHLHHPSTVFDAEFLRQCDADYPLSIWNTRFNEASHFETTDAMLYLDWKFTLADNDLVKVNSMCELAGIEVAYPMLDDEMIQLSTHISAQDKLPGQQLRKFYKEAVRGFLPEATLNKSKHGFGLPFGLWLKEHPGLRDLVSDKLGQLKKREIFRTDFIDSALQHHESGHASFYGELVWIMLLLELWLESAS